MAGWRAGFVAGNTAIVDRLKHYHYQMGSMITGSVQDAGTVALDSDQSCVAELADLYARRRSIVAEGLEQAGLRVFDSPGGIYVWAKVPGDWSGDRMADYLLDKAQVAVLPGSCFGTVGLDYVRLSLLKPQEQLQQAVERIGKVLG
jgi:aminotransferase